MAEVLVEIHIQLEDSGRLCVTCQGSANLPVTLLPSVLHGMLARAADRMPHDPHDFHLGGGPDKAEAH